MRFRRSAFFAANSSSVRTPAACRSADFLIWSAMSGAAAATGAAGATTAGSRGQGRHGVQEPADPHESPVI